MYIYVKATKMLKNIFFIIKIIVDLTAVFSTFRFYYIVGWGAPVILTSIWTLMTANEFHGVACWVGYNFSTTYMVLEGPRLVVIFVSSLFSPFLMLRWLSCISVLFILYTELLQFNLVRDYNPHFLCLFVFSTVTVLVWRNIIL